MSTTTLCLPSPSEAADSLAAVGAEFHARGWSVGTSSNYSMVSRRDPLELVVTASGMDKGKLSPSDFVSIGGDGQPVRPDQPKSSAETMLHVVIANQSDQVGAVLHTHSIWGTLLSRKFGDQGGFEISGFEMLKGLEGITTHQHRYWVPIFENTQDIPILAEQLERRLDGSDGDGRPMEHGFLIRGHGLYTWGKDLFTARRHIEIFEFLFECVAREIHLNSGTQVV